MLTCGQNQHQNTLTVFHSNSHHVFLEILLFISSGSKQMSKISDQRTCQATESMSWMVTEYLNYSGGKNERKGVDRDRAFILKIRVLNFFFFFFFFVLSRQILIPQPGIEPMPRCSGNVES